MGPRYDVGYGLLLLVLLAGFVAVFGFPTEWNLSTADPATVANDVALCLMAVAGVLGLVAAGRPESTGGGRRADYLTFRGLSTVALGLSAELLALAVLLGEEFLALAVLQLASGLFLVAMGVGTMLRRPTLVPARRERARSAE